MVAQIPPDEESRLKQLNALRILDTLPEGEFDDLVETAASLLQVPIVLISLIDAERQWFKSKIGMDVCETSRDLAFCAHAILQSEPLVVPDATKDLRFSDNLLVTEEFHLRFYAGAQIVVQGQRLGTLCCLDKSPREFLPHQIAGLAGLAKQVALLFEARLLASRLSESERRFAAFLDNAPAVAFLKDRERRITYANKGFDTLAGLKPELIMGLRDEDWLPEEVAAELRVNDEMVLLSDQTLEVEEWVPDQYGSGKYWHSLKFPVEWQGETWLGCVAHDITQSKRNEVHAVKLAEELALQSESLSEAQKLAKCGSWEFELVTGKFTWSNEMFRIFGYDSSDAVPSMENILDRTHPDDRNAVSDLVRNTMERWEDGELTHRLLIGNEERVVRVNSNTRLKGKIKGTVQDVTESVRASEALAEAKQFAESMAENAASILYLFDFGSMTTVWSNHDFAKFLGYVSRETGEPGNQFLASVLHPDDAPILSNLREEFAGVSDGEVVEFEMRFRHVSGEWRWLWNRASIYRRNPDGSPAQIMGSAQDITERRNSEAELARSEARFRSAIHSMHEGLCVQSKTGEILLANGRAGEILGLTNDELTGRTSIDPRWRSIHMDGTPWPGHLHPAMVALSEGTEQNSQVMGIHKASGECVWVLVNAVPLFHDAQKEPYAVVVTFTDVTERRAFEEQIASQLSKIQEYAHELEAQKRELSASNAELEQFAYAASHDLIEPSRMVNAYMELLSTEQGDRLDDEGRQFISFAMEGGNRMRCLILDLLEFSRLGRQELKATNIDSKSLMDETLKDLKISIAEKNANITVSDMSQISGDRAQLGRLFQNLISNSLKFSKTDDCHIKISACPMGEFTRFTVEDNGIGIDPRFTERVFGLFQRLQHRDKFPGSGIGLSLCRRIVERHGGRIWVEPEVQEGCQISFTLRAA